MNKTVNINIGGLFFHIDEDAYQKLNDYYEAVKRSLSNSSEKEEVMKDIEMRVAELLMERQKSDKHVVNIKDVEQIISIMGQPEDYRIDGESEEIPASAPTHSTSHKKLYRDDDNGIIGGVCAGLSHYIGIDVVWIRILFLLLAFVSFGIIIYIAFWIATPKAVTTAEKLEMKGESVNISNIEKKVKEEFENISKKIKNADYEKIGGQVRSGAEKASSGLGEILNNLFKIFTKFLGAFILVFSSVTLALLVIGFLTLGSASFFDSAVQRYMIAFNYTEIPLWIFSITSFLAIGIPFFFFLQLGLKLLLNNFKPIGHIARYCLISIWIFVVAGLLYIAILHHTEKAYEGKIILKESLPITTKDTLNIKFVTNDYFSKDINENEDLKLMQDSLKNEVIYSNNIHLIFKKTDETKPYLQIEKTADGKSYADANARAEKINYGFKLVGNELKLDNYLLTDIASKYRNQEVTLYLYLPEGTVFKTDQSGDSFIESEDDFFYSPIISGSNIYKVGKDKIKCLNCESDLDEDDDFDINVENNDDSNHGKKVSIKINGKEIIKTVTED